MYRADQVTDAGLVPLSSQLGQYSDYSDGNQDDVGLRVRQESQDSLQNVHQNEAQTCPESPPSTFDTVDHNNPIFAERFGCEDSEIPADNSTLSRTDSIPLKDPVETTSIQNVAVQQFELGSSNCSYDPWPFIECMDSDLFDLNPQLGANADIRA